MKQSQHVAGLFLGTGGTPREVTLGGGCSWRGLARRRAQERIIWLWLRSDARGGRDCEGDERAQYVLLGDGVLFFMHFYQNSIQTSRHDKGRTCQRSCQSPRWDHCYIPEQLRWYLTEMKMFVVGLHRELCRYWKLLWKHCWKKVVC